MKMHRFLIVMLFFFASCEKSNGNDLINNDNEVIDKQDSMTVEPEVPQDDTVQQATNDIDFLLYIGTYTDGGSKGIYLSKFDADSGIITTPELVATINNPSFQCVTADKKQLWSVNESWSGIGQVVGYDIDSVSGALTKIKAYGCEGNSPCFISYHESTNNILAANYTSGDVIRIPVTETGLPNGSTQLHKHTGKGPNASRQASPHAHCIKIDPQGKYLYSCDLGGDKIYVYTIENGALKVFKEIKTSAGAGPRHLDFHPTNKCMAVVHELNGTVVTYLPDADGCFSIENTTVKTLPDSYKGQSQCADIHFSPNGKFLYASNRGNNSIVIYKMKDETTPEIVDWQTQNLEFTRNFVINSSGKFLIAANQNGNTVVVFNIDQETGKLTFTGNKISISKPVCVTLIEK